MPFPVLQWWFCFLKMCLCIWITFEGENETTNGKLSNFTPIRSNNCHVVSNVFYRNMRKCTEIYKPKTSHFSRKISMQIQASYRFKDIHKFSLHWLDLSRPLAEKKVCYYLEIRNKLLLSILLTDRNIFFVVKGDADRATYSFAKFENNPCRNFTALVGCLIFTFLAKLSFAIECTIGIL